MKNFSFFLWERDRELSSIGSPHMCLKWMRLESGAQNPKQVSTWVTWTQLLRHNHSLPGSGLTGHWSQQPEPGHPSVDTGIVTARPNACHFWINQHVIWIPSDFRINVLSLWILVSLRKFKSWIILFSLHTIDENNSDANDKKNEV